MLSPRMLLLVLVVGWAQFGAAVRAEPVITIGNSVSSAGRISFDQVDHGDWDRLLHKYVDQNGNVDYQMWKSSSVDTGRLRTYLESLAAVDPQSTLNRNDRLAFWMNAYNSLTIHGILREYPTTSIRNHTATLFGYNIWKDLKLRVGDQTYSLDEMEHQILRPMGDPRVHFGIVCASRGCPRLPNEAFVGARVQRQLEANTRDFFARPQNFRYDVSGNRIHLSTILKWFGSDFGHDQRAILKRIAPWLPDERSRTAATHGAVSVSYLRYDWTLNDQQPSRE